MRKLLHGIAIFLTLSGATLGAESAAHAAPRQLVVIVAEGLSPKAIELGGSYVKSASLASTGEEEPSALSEFTAKAKTITAGDNSLSALRGVLAKAAAKGYKTGFVTTGEVAQVAPLFYDVSGENIASDLLEKRPFDFAAGGGRAAFATLDAAKKLKAAGGTALLSSEDVENTETEVKGKTLVLADEGALPYAADVDPEKDVSLGTLSGLAMNALGGENDDAPYVLIIHDALLSRALENKDTPAFTEEVRELDGIIAEAVGRRESKTDASQMGIALLATGGNVVPRFSSESTTDRSNALYVLSQLPYSYQHAGELLKGANAERITQFTDEEYKGWKISAEKRAGITAGTVNAETEIRASYEPSIAIAYDMTETPATLYAVGFDVTNLGETLDALPATKAAK